MRGEILLFAVAACSFEPVGNGGTPQPDAAIAGDPDAGTEPGASTHILLTEVKTAPEALEFVEIYNPTCHDLSLGTYYLTDMRSYMLLPSWGAAPPSPGLENAVVRFPAGETLASAATAIVARDGGAFANEYGAIPRFAMTNIGDSTGMEFVVFQTVQDMTILNLGEPIVLFEWDGERDLVADVDIVVAGDAPPLARQLVAKQDLAPGGVDGPDVDTSATNYLEESVAIPTMRARENNAGSYQRIAPEGAFEASIGGNGVIGHDETSEDTRNTWEHDVGTPPTPGSVPLALAPSCP